MRTKPFMLAILPLSLGLLISCATTSPNASSVIEQADLVPRSEACRAFQPAKISRESPPDLINYVVAADAAWMAFCKKENNS
jgi:hypothetical protein